MKYTEVLPEKTPASAIPYRKVNQPFRFQFVIPGPGIRIKQDANGVCYIETEGGQSLEDLVAGDNIVIERTEDGKTVISSVNTATDIAAGQNISIDIDPQTGTAIINSIIGGPTNEHYKGVFDSTEDLIAADPDPETGDYGMVKNIVVSNGETSWNGQYKYCFYINGQWTVVDQMLTFTKDLELLQQYYSVGGSSPVIYLHEIARSGDFLDLNNIPIVDTPVVTVEGTTVTAYCATEGAEIWYTTDGTMPHVNGTKYTGPITATGATTFRFVGIKNGMINSLEAVASADYMLKAPSIELDWHDGTITMTNPNLDGNNEPIGDIYYTTDGSKPTSASTLYTGPFVVTQQTTFKLIVINTDDSHKSAVTERLYRINGQPSMGHSMSQATGVMSCQILPSSPVVADYELRYTLDGSTPTSASLLYSSAIQLPYYGGPYVFKIKKYAPGYIPSPETTYTLGAEKPVSPPIHFNAETNTITLVDSEQTNTYSGTVCGKIDGLPGSVTYDSFLNFNNHIFYTLDGSTPSPDNGTLYTGPFQITGNVTVKAVLVAYGQYYSDVATESIVMTSSPSFTLDSGTGDLTISGPAGSTLYYTTDGSTPTTDSTQYTEPVNLRNNSTTGTVNVTVKAIAVVNGQESAVAEQTFTQIKSPLHTDRVNLNSGKCTVKLSTTSGHTIRYTLDGSLPGPTSTEYTGDIIYDYYNTPTIKYFEIAEGYIPSAVVTLHYGALADPEAPTVTYDEDTGMVTMALAGDTSAIPLQTNNNVPDMGARIWYTLDGSTPDSSTGTLWTGTPFALPEGVTVIKAITECYGAYDSDVTTVNKFIDYLKFTALTNVSAIGAAKSSESGNVDLEYSLDNGSTWNRWANYGGVSYIYMNEGDTVVVRGDNPEGLNGLNFVFGGNVAVSGDVTSLINRIGGMSQLPPGALRRLFSLYYQGVGPADISGLKFPMTDIWSDPEELSCVDQMFWGVFVPMSEDGVNLIFDHVWTYPETGKRSSLPYTLTIDNDMNMALWILNGCTGFPHIELTPEVNSEGGSMNSGFYAYPCYTWGNKWIFPSDRELIVDLHAIPNNGFIFSKYQISTDGVNWSDLPGGSTAIFQYTLPASPGTYYIRPVFEEEYPGLRFTMPNGGVYRLEKTGSPNPVDLEISRDNGHTWIDWLHKTDSGASGVLNAGETVCIRNKSQTNTGFSTSASDYYKFSFDAECRVSGNIMSLKCSDPDSAIYETFCFGSLFMGCGTMVSTPYIPLANGAAPFCLYSVFRDCVSLVEVSEIPFTSLQEASLRSACRGCSSLTSIRTKMTDISALNCLTTWVQGVSPSGDFYCSPNLVITSGDDGIPSGWTRHDINE